MFSSFYLTIGLPFYSNGSLYLLQLFAKHCILEVHCCSGWALEIDKYLQLYLLLVAKCVDRNTFETLSIFFHNFCAGQWNFCIMDRTILMWEVVKMSLRVTYLSTRTITVSLSQSLKVNMLINRDHITWKVDLTYLAT